MAFSLLLSACAGGRFGPKADAKVPDAPRSLKKLSVAERQQLLSRAQVWQAVDTASLDLTKGPTLPAQLRIGPQVSCAFVFPEEALSGMTPKFLCSLPPSPGLRGTGKKDDVVKVKYGEKNGEVYAEVAASRLLWALGFKADAMEPTQVTCLNCPPEPFTTSAADWQRGSPSDVATRVYNPAVIERGVAGDEIKTPGYDGWAWPELEQVSPRAGGAPRAHVDALKLLAVFIQHSDTKPDQQKIICAPGRTRKLAKGSETYASPWLVIKDLGGTFGKATKTNTSKMSLEDWSSVHVWKDAKQCIGNLPRSLTGSLEDPAISEAGRRFLAQRLTRLSDRQIRSLFTASKVMQREETIAAADGSRRRVTVDDWVRVFKAKRSEVVAARCA